jgi:hypothetical protein
MPTFNIGDRVRRNDINEDGETDANNIKFGWEGVITEINRGEDFSGQPYLVKFNLPDGNARRCTTWWIAAKYIELLEPVTQETKEQRVINKIKYLNDKFNNRKSRVVPDTVGLGEQRELREGTVGIIPQGVITRTPTRGWTGLTASQITAITDELVRLRRTRTDAYQRGSVHDSLIIDDRIPF